MRDAQVSGEGEDTEDQSLVRSDVLSMWCMVAVPDVPTRGSDGSISAACEALAVEDADDLTVIGTRDVRYAKFGADLKPGESAFFNKFGSRLAMKEIEVSIVAKGGAFLNFSVEKKLVSLCGFPKNPGDPMPYLTIDSDSIGLTSATGASSISCNDGQVTISGKSASLDVGSIVLGSGATMHVALAELVAQVLELVRTIYNAHTHPTLGSTPVAPLPPFQQIASRAVKCA